LRARAQADAAIRRRCLPCDSPDRSPSARHAAASPHRVALPATSCRPRLPSTSRSAGPSSGTPAAAAGDLHPDNAVPGSDRDGLPGEPPAGCAAGRCRTARSRAARHQPRTGCPGPVTPAVNARATRARSAHPTTVTLTWTAVSAISAPPARRPRPRKQPDSRGGHRGMYARSGGARQAGTSRQRGPSVAVRGKPTVRTDRASGPDAVRYTSVDTATHRLTVTHADTRRDKKKTARLTENSQLAGRFAGSGRCWVRTNVG
jgi:hypothetical protein